MRLALGTNMKEVLATFKQFENEKFVWGKTDCCQFVSAYLERKTGKNLAKQYGNYTTELGAQRAQVKHGTFAETMDKHFNAISPVMVQRGDVVMFESPTGLGLAIATATDIWAMTEGLGLRAIKHEVIKAWRVV